MPLGNTPLLYQIEVTVWDPGEADPRPVLRPYAWWEEWVTRPPAGVSSRDSRRRPLLEWLQGVGVTNRRFRVAQNTRLAHYTQSGGAWEEWRPETGERVYELQQYDGSPGVSYLLTSSFAIPEGCAWALKLTLPDSPPDWDFALLPPYVRVEFGPVNGQCQWAVEFSKDGGVYLLRWDAAGQEWDWAMDLPAPPRGTGYADGEPVYLWVRPERGRLGLSLDDGRSYTWYGEPGTVSVAGGPWKLRGRGGTVRVGLHQLLPSTAVYTSQQQGTGTMRVGASPTFALSRYETPDVNALAWTDLSDSANQLAQFRATFTPEPVLALPFTFHRCPVVTAPCFYYPVTAVTTSSAHTVWSNTGAPRVLSCHVQRPYDLGQASCTLRVRIPPGGSLPAASWRGRKIRVRLGWKTDPLGATTWWTVFTGYTGGRPEAVRTDWGGTVWEVTAEAARWWRRARWSPEEVVPLGLLGTPNAAADFILGTEGIVGLNLPVYRSWHSYGSSVALPAGLPEDPFELVRPGEPKWETLSRLFDHADLELGVNAAGQLFTLRRNLDGTPATTGAVHDYRATETNDLYQAILSERHAADYDAMATAVVVSGADHRGLPVRAVAVDGTAEGDKTSDRFCPWRELELDEVSGSASLGLVQLRAAVHAYRLFRIPWDLSLTAHPNLGVGRRDVVRVYGSGELGTPDAAEAVVLTQDIAFEQPDQGAATAEMTLGVWRQ